MSQAAEAFMKPVDWLRHDGRAESLTHSTAITYREIMAN